MDNLLGTFIKNYVNEHSITINDLAKQMDVPHSTVARWARGGTTPSIHQLAKLANATSTDICTLVYLLVPSERRDMSATVRQLAERISKLPNDGQQLIEAMLMAVAIQDTNKRRDQ